MCVSHCSYEEPSASGSNLLSPFQPDLVGSYLVTTRTADSANLTVHGFNEAGAANGTGAGLVTFYPNGTFLWRREFGINLLSGYSYNVTVGLLFPAVLASRPSRFCSAHNPPDACAVWSHRL